MTIGELWKRGGGIEKSNYEQQWNMILHLNLGLHWFKPTKKRIMNKYEMWIYTFTCICSALIQAIQPTRGEKIKSKWQMKAVTMKSS